MKPIIAPEFWEAEPYGKHWSFAYELDGKRRKDYDFRVSFDHVDAAEEQMVIRLIEQAPRLLRALDRLLQETVDQDLKHGIALTEGEQEAREQALEVIAAVAGEVA